MKYSLFARCAMDEVPLGLFDDKAKAQAVADAFDEADFIANSPSLELLNIDVSGVVNLSVFIYDGEKFVGWEILRDLDPDLEPVDYSLTEQAGE